MKSGQLGLLQLLGIWQLESGDYLQEIQAKYHY
jgi:hypothetical protein